MLLICVQHGWDSGMTTYGKCILNRPEKHSIVFNLMEQHSLHVKFLHIYNNKIQYDTIQGTITCPLLWTHPDCQSSITDCRSEVQTAVAESRRPLSSWLCSQRPMNFTAIIPTHQCARTDVYTKLLRNYTNWPKKNTFHSHVIAHSQRWGAPRLQVADILVLQFQALDSPGTAGTTRHAENQSSEILHCIVVSYIRAYTSYLHVCIYRCTSSR